MFYSNTLNLIQVGGGTQVKQGDLGSRFSYKLANEKDQELDDFDKEVAHINLVLDDKIVFTTTATVDNSTVTFNIDKAIPVGLYFLEIKIRDYIFPSDKQTIIFVQSGAVAYDLKELVPNYDVNMTIKSILSDLSQKGIDISDLNRQLAQKANKDEVTNVMTPKGNIAYASLPMTGNSVGWYYYCPDGDGVHGAGNYVWNGKSWFFGGTGDEGYNLLKKDIDIFHTIENIPVVAEFENEYLTSSYKSGHNGFAISNVIVLKKGDVIKVTTNLISNMVAIKSTINSKYCGTKYSLDVVNELTAGEKERTYKAIEDIEYIRYTYNMTSGANVRVYRVNDNKNYDAVLNESISGYFNKGLYYAEGGGCYVTKNIHLKKGEILNYGCSAGTYNVVAVLVKMENDNAISVIQTANDNDYHEYKYEAQEDCEVSFSFSAIHRAFAFIQRSDDALEEIKENLTGINENLTGINEDLTGIKSELWIAKNNYVTMFKKIMCLGDSITYGYRTQQHSDTDRSYPSFLARLNSVETINGGISGATPQAWYNMRILNNSSMFNFADYDACIINLGQNGGLTDTLDEDVNQFSDPSQYADTQVAWYCKIVEHIISENPRIKMFLLRGQKDKITNTVIQKIAQKYNIPSFDYTEIDSNLLDTSRHIGEDGTNYGVHYNTLGYYELARAVTNGINSVIAKNTNNYRGL